MGTVWGVDITMDNEEVPVVEEGSVTDIDDGLTQIDIDILNEISLTLSLINQGQWFVFSALCILIGISLITVFLLAKGDNN